MTHSHAVHEVPGVGDGSGEDVAVVARAMPAAYRITLHWHKMKPGYYVAAGKRCIYEVSQQAPDRWWMLFKRDDLVDEGAFTLLPSRE
ncbi:MAG: hypothetical protein J2P17_15645 [Mycobacterium sp.]|nr:hypothetical protein [Mycobacterium sp.]